MNHTHVPSLGAGIASEPASQAVLRELAARIPRMTPEIRKAAAYVVENPNDVGVSSIRELAQAANVKPNTLVRMARAAGFEGFDDFRRPFREHIRNGRDDFPDRARWLQSLSKGGKLGGLFAAMAATSISNIENTFAATDAMRVKAAADTIVNARDSYVLGVGISHALARNFAYLAAMAVDNVQAIPREGSLATDDLARAGSRDVLLALTFKPYRAEVVEAVEIARSQGVHIIGISDSPASPLVLGSEHGFVVPTGSPQFFTSTLAAGALLETMMAFVIADASPDVIANIERFHERRHELGIYWEDGRH
ncbi:MAG: MurR/RpiR family transcriptional regulator [Gammaproteobacteria bacterium]